MPRFLLAVTLLLALAAVEARAQDPVVGAPDADALFHSPDPKLDRNKQAAYHIEKDLLEAGHWEMADQWLTERYIQHNPNAASGRAGVVDYFTKVLKVAPKPIAAKLARPVVAVIAEGDYVIVDAAHASGSEGPDAEVHDDLVRPVALLEWEGRRALGRRDEVTGGVGITWSAACRKSINLCVFSAHLPPRELRCPRHAP